jgi:hypothetical protein
MEQEMVKVKFLRGNVGYESVMKKSIAVVLDKRGDVRILGEGKPEPKPAKQRAPKDTEALEKRLAKFKDELKAEKAKSHPNENALRAFNLQIENLEKELG